MNCLCGHPRSEHVRGGRCREVDCPCERFEPGDTLGSIDRASYLGVAGPATGQSSPRTSPWMWLG
jgi:hypothetical protein